jgi:hypothetical protein
VLIARSWGAGGLFDGNADAGAGAVVAEGSKGGQACGGAVAGGQGVEAGGGEIVHRPRLGVADPEREVAGGEHGQDAAAVGVRLLRSTTGR